MVHLPAEILLQILANKQIDKLDLKNLRLASKWISTFATEFLFSRIYISRLKSDSESFFNIAAQPHLAVAVQTVAWLEMAEDETSFMFADIYGDRDDVDDNFFSLLRPLARALFWLPLEDSHGLCQASHYESSTMQYKGNMRERAEAIQTFTPQFFRALHKMPKLKELTSQPMPPQREFIKPFGLSPSQYPFTCQMFLRTMCRKGPQRNDGFCTFLIPYMAHRANLHTLEPITRLRLVDESIWTCTGRFDQTFVKSFESLTHLDLCVSNFHDASEFRRLGQCLKAATALGEIRLCFERSRICTKHTQNFFRHLFPSGCKYPSLRTLVLVDMPSTGAVLKFITKVASSLKALKLDNTAVTVTLLDMLSRIPDLRLEQFMSISDQGP